MECMHFNSGGLQAVVRGLIIKLGICYEVTIITPFMKVSRGFTSGGTPELIGVGCNT